MVDWLYLFTQNQSYPEPLAEISALAALIEEGLEAFLLLPDRKGPPMSASREGEQVLLCTRERGRLFKHGVATVAGAPRLYDATPLDVAAIYGPKTARPFLELADVRLTAKLAVDEMSDKDQAFAARQNWTTSAREEWTTCETALARANARALTVRGPLRGGSWVLRARSTHSP